MHISIPEQNKTRDAALTLPPPPADLHEYLEAVPALGGTVWRARRACRLSGTLALRVDGNYLPVCITRDLSCPQRALTGTDTTPHEWQQGWGRLVHRLNYDLLAGDHLLVGTWHANPDRLRVSGDAELHAAPMDAEDDERRREGVRHVTDVDFARLIGGATPALVACCASWCAPCRQIAPALEQIAAERAGRLTVARLDVDAARRTATRLGVRSLPTLLLFKAGEVAATTVGAMPKARLEAWLESELRDGDRPDPASPRRAGGLDAEVAAAAVEVPVAEVMAAWRESPAAALRMCSWFDGTFRALPGEVWLRVLTASHVDRDAYVAEWYDCGDFAMAAKVDIARRWGVNGVVVVIDHSGRHAYTALLVVASDGRLSWLFVEPQTDAVVTLGAGQYAAREGFALI